jgi:hypothetical protein
MRRASIRFIDRTPCGYGALWGRPGRVRGRNTHTAYLKYNLILSKIQGFCDDHFEGAGTGPVAAIRAKWEKRSGREAGRDIAGVSLLSVARVPAGKAAFVC